MKHLLPLLLVATLCTTPLASQRGGGHTLFGDLKVDESKVSGVKPQTFYLILYDNAGNVTARQSVSNNGRYRFLDVRNGEYNLAVEVDTQEVARVHLFLTDVFKTDIRKDLELEWNPGPGAKPAEAGRTSTISTADFYNRPTANKPRFEKAQEAQAKNAHGEAIGLFKQVTDSDPKDFEAWTELGTAHFKSGHIEDAERAYARALAEQPLYFLGLLNLGRLRMAQKNYEGAVEVLARALEARKDSAPANLLLGEAWLQLRKGSRAVGYLNEAIRLDPVGSAEAHLRLAALYNAAGLKDKAAAEYEQFLARKPDYAERKKLQDYIRENKR